MKKQFIVRLDKIADSLHKINQDAIKAKDNDAKNFSCYLVEQIETRLSNEE